MSIYRDKAKETLDLLRANPEWIDRYKKYADEISGNVAMLKERKINHTAVSRECRNCTCNGADV